MLTRVRKRTPNTYKVKPLTENERALLQPPLDEVWLDEQGQHNQKQELEEQRQKREEKICEKNQVIHPPTIISLNKPNDSPFFGVSDDESCDSLVGWLPSVTERGVFDSTDSGSSSLPAPSISQPS